MRRTFLSLILTLPLFLLPQVASAACNASPTDATNAATSITVSAGTVNGNVSSAGGGTCAVTARGFATSTVSNLTSSVATSSLGGTTGAYSASWNSAALTGNTTYYFRAYATNSNSTGYGTILNFLTLPAAPTALTFGSIADTTMSVSWTAPTGGASTYTLERCTNGTNTCSQTSAIGGTSQSVTLLTGNTNYDFAVQGVNTTGSGAFTATSSQLTLPSAPGSPTYTLVAKTSLTVNWSVPTGGAATYNLERCTHGTNTCSFTSAIAASSQAVSSLTTNTSYDFAVQAVNATGNSVWSATSTQATLPPDPNGVIRLNGGNLRITSGNLKVQ